MRSFTRAALVAFIFVGVDAAIAAPSTFAELNQDWSKNKDNPAYSEYQKEFVQYNNYLRLDTKDDCFALGQEKLRLFLVITTQAIIESVVTEVNTPKAECFKRTYTGLRVKSPPFSPLIINMIIDGKPNQ